MQQPEHVYDGPAYRCRSCTARSVAALRDALDGRGLKIAHNAELRQKFNDHKTGFPVGSLITFAAFTSVSLDDQVANGFGDHVLFNFIRVRGVRIRALSAVPQEAEVLVPPPSVFRIVAVAMFHGSLVVTLERADSPLTYLALPPVWHPIHTTVLPTSNPLAGGGDAAPDPALEALTDSLVSLKLGAHKACAAFAEVLYHEGVVSVEDLSILSEAKTRDLLSRAGMKELQQMKVLQAIPRAPPNLKSSSGLESHAVETAGAASAGFLAPSAGKREATAAAAAGCAHIEELDAPAPALFAVRSPHVQPFWMCGSCTFHNADMTSQHCSVCHSRRDPAKALSSLPHSHDIFNDDGSPLFFSAFTFHPFPPALEQVQHLYIPTTSLKLKSPHLHHCPLLCDAFNQGACNDAPSSPDSSLQAAAAARITGKPSIFQAAENGDFALVKDHVTVDPSCVCQQNR
jgi:hypothetical protein